MKLFAVLLTLLSVNLAFSQLNSETIEKKDGWYTKCYHENGSLATDICRPKNGAYGTTGYARAYNNTGKLIYDSETSRSALVRSVSFTYYSNGAVKSARYYQHPDGGIQWYEKTTMFDKEGNITQEIEHSWDDNMNVIQTKPVEQ